MATLTVGDLTPRDQYTATSGQTVFTYSFPIFNDSDLKVYVGSTLKTLTTHYTVSGAGTSSGGNITFGSGLTTGDIATIYRDLPVSRTTDYATGGALLAENLNDDLDKLVMMIQQVEYDLNNRVLRFGQFTTGIPLSEFTESATDRAGKVLSFDSSGDPNITQELGVWQGNWAASTAYVLRDIVKDSSNSNVYICVTAHTSSGSTPISSNTDVAKWALLIDAAAAGSSATAAASSATAAASSATAAAASATSAQSSEDDATTAQTAAELAETHAETAETNAETAETAAETAQTAAESAKTSAQSSQTSATASATSATVQQPVLQPVLQVLVLVLQMHNQVKMMQQQVRLMQQRVLQLLLLKQLQLLQVLLVLQLQLLQQQLKRVKQVQVLLTLLLQQLMQQLLPQHPQGQLLQQPVIFLLTLDRVVSS